MPSPDQIAAAVGLLRDDLLRDFPFADENARRDFVRNILAVEQGAPEPASAPMLFGR